MEEVDDGSECHESDDAGGNESNMSGSEQSEGKLYFLTTLGQHEEMKDRSDDKSQQVKNRRRKRGDIMRALGAAWNKSEKERANNGNQRSTIRKTLLPVSCPVCFKVLSNAYNLKVYLALL